MIKLTSSTYGYVMDNEALDVFLHKLEKLCEQHKELQTTHQHTLTQQRAAADEIQRLIHRLNHLEETI